MAKLYFKYGTMGSSKSAQALMCEFNYKQKGFNVLLLKPKLDTRDNVNEKTFVSSRIGLKSECFCFSPTQNLIEFFNYKNKDKKIDVIIVDEAQFCTESQIDELKELSVDVTVLCYGLKTNFKTKLFDGSKRLIELADNISEIKSVCKCGNKAIINARFINKKFVSEGTEILIGGDESYEAMCYNCYKKLLNNKLN